MNVRLAPQFALPKYNFMGEMEGQDFEGIFCISSLS